MAPLSASERGWGRGPRVDERGARNIIVGQAVDPDKLAFAKRLRREMTPEERILWGVLRANRFHGLRFRRQQVIDGYIVDFYCHALRLIVEVDGDVHARQQEYDTERDAALASRGMTIMRVSNGEVVNDVSHVLRRIEALLPSRAASAEIRGS